MNDLLHSAIRDACRRFDAHDNIFTLACLSKELGILRNSGSAVDGKLLRLLLVGRTDVRPLAGGSHFEFIENVR
jgi:hypothetical protein